jgi:hypothetical protein
MIVRFFGFRPIESLNKQNNSIYLLVRTIGFW